MWKAFITNFYHWGRIPIKKQDLGINFQLSVFRCAPENSKALWSQWLALLRLFSLGELVSWLNATPQWPVTDGWNGGEIGVAAGWRKVSFILDGWRYIGECVAKITERPVMSFCISGQSPYNYLFCGYGPGSLLFFRPSSVLLLPLCLLCRSNSCIRGCFAHSQGLHVSCGNTVLIQCHLFLSLFKHTGPLLLVKSHFSQSLVACPQ